MFSHILAPLDGSTLAEGVLPHLTVLARAFNARVTVLRVLEPVRQTDRPQPVDPLEWHLARTEAETYLKQLASGLEGTGLQVETVLLEGHPADRIVEFAHSHSVDLILLSSHGRSGLGGWNVSSIVQKVILQSRLSTMIVRAYQPVPVELADTGYRRILVPLDCSQRAECVLPAVMPLVEAAKSHLLLAHVVREPEMPRRAPLTPEETQLIEQVVERNRQEAASYLEQLQQRLAGDVETRLLVSRSVIASLHDLADEVVDLVALCAHGYAGPTRWPYGSVAISFIAYGTTPLLIVQDSPETIQTSPVEIATREYKGH